MAQSQRDRAQRVLDQVTASAHQRVLTVSEQIREAGATESTIAKALSQAKQLEDAVVLYRQEIALLSNPPPDALVEAKRRQANARTRLAEALIGQDNAKD